MDIFQTIIVDAASAASARAQAAQYPGGSGMFVTGLSASGLEPATHFISSGIMPAMTITGADVSSEPPFTALARKGLKIVIPAGV